MAGGTLHVFDLDDTLLIAPSFSDFAKKDSNNIVDIDGNFSEFFKKIKSFFYIVFSKEIYYVTSGDYIVIYDTKSKAPLSVKYLSFIQDLNPDSMSSHGLKRGVVKDVLRALDIKDGNLVFKSIPGFHEDPTTIGNIVNNSVLEAYQNSKNKMILTGRGEALRKEIEARLLELGLDMPNYGLYLFPGGGISIQNYKIETILNTIKKHNWIEIHFYEDRKDWLESAEKSVIEHFPQVKFYPHLITNTKQLHSL